jgi:hypothetical protein
LPRDDVFIARPQESGGWPAVAKVAWGARMGWIVMIGAFALAGAELRRRRRAGSKRRLMRQTETVWLEAVGPAGSWRGPTSYVLHDPGLPGGERSYAGDRLAAIVAFETSSVRMVRG